MAGGRIAPADEAMARIITVADTTPVGAPLLREAHAEPSALGHGAINSSKAAVAVFFRQQRRQSDRT